MLFRSAQKGQTTTPPIEAPKPQPEPPPIANKPLPTQAQVIEQLFTHFGDILINRIIDRLLDLGVALQQQQTSHAKHNPQPIHDGAPSGRPGVLILGLLPATAHILAQQYPQLDITALDSDHATSREPIRRKHTILMTKFINHVIQDKYRKAPNLHYCNGGQTELRQILESLT